jgi:hypothetical protein
MIERKRKRPRVESVSFRTLGWLVRIEAQHAICFEHRADRDSYGVRRVHLDTPSSTRSYRAEVWLRSHPHRRFQP